MDSKWIFLGLVLLAVLLEVVADVLFKKWATENRSILLLAGLLIYFIGTIFWAFSLQHEYLSKAISIFVILNLVLVTLAGFFLFGENVSNPAKVGIVLGIVSVALIEFF